SVKYFSQRIFMVFFRPLIASLQIFLSQKALPVTLFAVLLCSAGLSQAATAAPAPDRSVAAEKINLHLLPAATSDYGGFHHVSAFEIVYVGKAKGAPSSENILQSVAVPLLL